MASQLKGLLANKEVTDIFFWQTLGAVLQAALAPEIEALTQESFNLTPTLVLSAAEYANAVVRGHMTLEDAKAKARLSGIDAEPFQTLIDSAGDPPPLEFLTQAWRRGIIPESGSGASSVSLDQGIRESRLKDKWIPSVKAMQFLLAPPGVVIEGWLRGQLEEAEALKILEQNGIAEDTARLMYKASGRPPGPMELIELTRRGVIPEDGEGGDTLSLRQGYLETDLKNKWWPAWKELMTYVPPPRTVVALLRTGALTDAQATAFLKDAGLPAELTAAYVANAHHENAQATRELTKSEVMALYAEGQFTQAETEAHLKALHYGPDVIALELKLADFQAERSLVSHAVNRVRAYFTARKIDEQTALDGLEKLGYPKAARDKALAAWRIERDDNVKSLTPAQILDLVVDKIESESTVLAMLQEEGYSARDAWYMLAIKLKGNQTSPKPG